MPTTLIAGQHGSDHFGTRPYLGEALRATAKAAPVALYVGAASGDHASFGASLSALLTEAGAARVVWPRLVGRRRDPAAVRTLLAEVDFVFVGGGDVEQGMEVLHGAEVVEDIRAAATRGVVFAGMSAGAIMLGERWIRWPHAGAGDDEAETYECLGLAPCSLDTHGEGDDWQETRAFAAVRARELGREATVYGVPSGGALVVDADGTVHARGERVPVFVGRPNGLATLLRTLAP